MKPPKRSRATSGSQVVGVVAMAQMYNRSRWWAHDLLREWYEEQKNGGPIRVFKHGKNGALSTTLAVLHQCMPPARDMQLVRQVERLERDVTYLARRCDQLTARIVELEHEQPPPRTRR